MHRDQERGLHSRGSSHHHWFDRQHNPSVHLDRRLPKLHHSACDRTKHLRQRVPKPNHLHRRRQLPQHSHPHCERVRPDHHRDPVSLGRHLHCHPQPDGDRVGRSLFQQHCGAIHHHHHPRARRSRGRGDIHHSARGSRWYCRWLRRRTKAIHRCALQGCGQQALRCRCRSRRFPRSRCLPPVSGPRLLYLMTAVRLAFFGSGFLQTYLCVRVSRFKGMM